MNSQLVLLQQAELNKLRDTWIAAGVFAVNKPPNWTSHDVVAFLKKFLKVKKIGHGGTLDPLASGILVIGVNQATKQLNNHLLGPKVYLATIQLHVATTTGDWGGKVIHQTQQSCSYHQVIGAIAHFNGLSYYQVPPVYSALKVRGKKLYQYARANIPVELTPRLVEVKKLQLVSYCREQIQVLMQVSKGFYVRSLARDLGRFLNTEGCLNKLVRLSSGGFSLADNVIDIAHLKLSVQAYKKHED